ncbi:RNA binding motif protein 12Ba [Salarias fasciatus]|uniref:RNA binding motif protein 12Ba n=1 Tax=Salarias fasciatus TaxID=181472 RepID=UPI0011770166|nr:RNA-binding protein 12B-B-like [Salarias fasciatus]XP_029958795.1 RNA-binding protein 12B-B-like [Salarias fasciatus]
MTIVLRLTGLDAKAGIEDVRTFFENLHIPDGGVYILGGSLQEAFIAFGSEKDAQLALRQTGGYLRGSAVSLYISSMQEVEHKLETFLRTKKKNSLSVKRPQPQPAATPPLLKSPPQDGNVVNLSPSPASSVDPGIANIPHLNAQDGCSNINVQTSDGRHLDSSTAFILGVCSVLQGLKSSQQSEISNLLPKLNLQVSSPSIEPDMVKKPEQTMAAKPGYIRLFGLPPTTTKEDICTFFKGLTVQEAMVNVKLGLSHGCLVKFASTQDACEALHFNQRLLGTVCVEVRGATEKLWNSVLEECTNVGREIPQRNPCSGSINHKQKPTFAHQIKRKSASELPCKPPKTHKLDDSKSPFSPGVEQVVMVNNLPKTMTKTEIKELFECTDIPHKNVLHLLDKDSNRTDTAFLIFHRSEDYEYALNLSGCHVGAAAIKVSSITKIAMRQMIAKYRIRSQRHFSKMDRMIVENSCSDA